MEFEDIRPVFSGLLGGVIAIWVGNYMARKLPKSWAGISTEVLTRKHRVAIYLSNTTFILGIFFGLFLYMQGYFERSDWRGMGIGFGVSCLGPTLILLSSSIIRGHRVMESFFAYGVEQKMPLWLLVFLLGSGVALLIASLNSIAA